MSPVLDWHLAPYGESGLLLTAKAPLDDANRAVIALARRLEMALLPGVTLVQPTLTSLLVRFDPLTTTPAAVEALLRPLLPAAPQHDTGPARVVELHVNYGGVHGPDLEDVAQQLGLSPAEVVRLHTQTVFRVLMLGFAPGFAYIGPLPSALTLPRRATPRPAVAAGSVAIAAGMTGIYPQRLPGGWHIIGHTSAMLFNPARTPPSLVQLGDGVRFISQLL